MNRVDQAEFGQYGSEFLTGAEKSATIPDGKVIVAITALEATTLDATNTTTESGFDKPVATVPIPVGTTIYGRFTAVELDGGSCMVYFA